MMSPADLRRLAVAIEELAEMLEALEVASRRQPDATTTQPDATTNHENVVDLAEARRAHDRKGNR